MNSINQRKSIILRSIIKPGLRFKILLLLKHRGRSMKIVPQSGLVVRFKPTKSSLFVFNSIFNYQFCSLYFLDSKNLIRFWAY